MLKGPIAAARYLDGYIGANDKPRQLRALLQHIIEKENDLDPTDAADLADRWFVRFESRIQLELQRALDDGNFLSYTFNSSGADFLQGSCFPEPNDSDKTKEQKQSRLTQERYVNYFSELNPTEFENLCGKVIQLLRVEEAYVTRNSADQGVDFFGRLPVGLLIKPSEISPGAEKNLSVWLVGQAKHYKNMHVSTKDIRELVGSVTLARSKVFAGSKDPLKGLNLRVCDPIVYLFITTGRFTRDSRDLLKKSGVVAMDGIQLSVFLADHRAAQGVGDLTFEDLSEWIKP